MQAQKAEGTRDLIGAEMRAWQKMQQIAAGVFEPFGFKPIETPAIEQVDVFVHGIGQSTDVVRKEMFRVFSGANLERVFTEGTDTKLKPKQRLALRPEGTAGEPNGWVMAAPLDAASRRQRSEGVRVLLLDRGFEGGEIADLPWLLPGAKSLSYGINMAAKRYAVANGADDVIFRAPSGKLLEGPTSSVVLDLDGVLVTPPLDGILRSITIEELVNGAPAAGLEVRIHELHRDDLGRCRGAWLLSSGRILARVTHVDGRELPSSPLDARLSRLLGVPWR